MFSEIFNYSKMFSKVQKNLLLFDNKEILKGSMMVWDLENIPFSKLGIIKKMSRYTPEKVYIVTKQPLGKKLVDKIERHWFKLMYRHKNSSDDKIIAILKLLKNCNNIIIISADSDFVKIIQEKSKGAKIQWILDDNRKKRIMMKTKLDNENIKISTF